MSYVDEVLEIVKKKNADQPEFLQAVTEVLDSLRPCIDAERMRFLKESQSRTDRLCSEYLG